LFLLFLATRAEAWNWRRLWARILALWALIWIALSAWPSLWVQAVLVLTSALWLLWKPKSSRTGLTSIMLRRAQLAVVVIAVIVELPFHRSVRLNAQDRDPKHWKRPEALSLAVMGDSVTAGLEPSNHTWPKKIVERRGWTVFDASQQGATVKSAAQQLAALDGRGDVLLIEIGGIDVLEQTSVRSFSHDLDKVLLSSQERYRRIFMVEIPLPPLGNRYGVVQRRLAQEYGVCLIPKHEFIAVLARAGGTVDGVHLSSAGQFRLADLMGTVFGNGSRWPGEYIRCEAPSMAPAANQPP
jgi:acyl-CoA thioesterase-1